MSSEVIALSLPSDPLKRGEAIAELVFPLKLELPCGSSMLMDDVINLPTTDFPCLCGNGRHWMVKYVPSS
jgi:hypothetical protein